MTIPYTIPNNTDNAVFVKKDGEVRNNEKTKGNAISAREPLRKWKKKIPKKLIFSYLESEVDKLLLHIFMPFKDSIETPFFQDRISINVITEGGTDPLNKPIKINCKLLNSMLWYY